MPFGTVNGEAACERRANGDFHDDFIYPNQVEMEKLVLLLRCRDVLIRDVVARGRGASVCNGHPERQGAVDIRDNLTRPEK